MGLNSLTFKTVCILCYLRMMYNISTLRSTFSAYTRCVNAIVSHQGSGTAILPERFFFVLHCHCSSMHIWCQLKLYSTTDTTSSNTAAGAVAENLFTDGGFNHHVIYVDENVHVYGFIHARPFARQSLCFFQPLPNTPFPARQLDIWSRKNHTRTFFIEVWGFFSFFLPHSIFLFQQLFS